MLEGEAGTHYIHCTAFSKHRLMMRPALPCPALPCPRPPITEEIIDEAKRREKERSYSSTDAKKRNPHSRIDMPLP